TLTNSPEPKTSEQPNLTSTESQNSIASNNSNPMEPVTWKPISTELQTPSHTGSLNSTLQNSTDPKTFKQPNQTNTDSKNSSNSTSIHPIDPAPLEPTDLPILSPTSQPPSMATMSPTVPTTNSSVTKPIEETFTTLPPRSAS